MASKDVKFLANLGLHGSLRFLETNADFPASPNIGDVILKGTELYAYIQIGDLSTWFPFANKTNAYIHTQGVSQTDWTVTHNLGTTDIWTQIRDSSNNIVYASMDNITANSFQLHFTEAITGTVVVVAPDSIDVPAVTTSIITVGNVEITGSNITINGQAVLTGGSFATVATSGLFADLLSKPTTLVGYGITDAQPLDADLSAVAALNGVGFAKRTGVDTWVLDNSTYLTGNQNITVSGDASGSGTTAITLTLANSGVTAGDYFKTTVNAKGLVTAGSNPTTLAGFGITDAAPLSHVGSGGSAHAAATTSTSGFMSATDKTKLDGVEANANNYSLPVATVSTLGGVKDGAGVTIAGDGTLSANVLSVAGQTGNVTLTNSDVGLGNVENKSSATIRSELTSGNVTGALGFTPENAVNKNAANGYAGLDANSKISSLQLPAIAITDTFVVASQAAMLALTAETGDVAVRTDLNKSFILQGTKPATLAHWQELLTPTDLVQSVNGMTGTVTISTISGNAGTATALQTARTLTLGTTGKSFDGSANVSWSLAEIGAQAAGNYSLDTHVHNYIINGTSNVDIASANGGVAVTVAGNNVVNIDTAGRISALVDASTPTDGSAYFYKNVNGARISGYQVQLEVGSAGSRSVALTVANTGDVLVGTSTDNGTDKLQVSGSAIITGNTQIGSGNTGSRVLTLVGATPRIDIDGATANDRDIRFATAGSLRWILRTEGSTESGSNVGSDFSIVRRSDAGADLGQALLIKRSSGNVLIGTTTDDGSSKLQVTGTASISVALVTPQVASASTLTLAASGANPIVFGTNGLERARISSSGNVGIGEASPTSKLQVSTSNSGEFAAQIIHSGTTGAHGVYISLAAGATGYPLGVVVGATEVFRIANTGQQVIRSSVDVAEEVTTSSSNSFIRFSNSTVSSGYIGYTAAGKLSFQTAAADRMIIDSAGFVGIGEASPGERLHVKGGATDTALRLENTAASTKIWNLTVGGGGNYAAGTFAIRNVTDGTTPLLITPTGNTISYGKVGIGTGPSSSLHVADDSANQLILQTSGNTGSIRFISVNNAGMYISAVANDFVIKTSDVEKFRINDNGRIGIGTSSPDYMLHVKSADNLQIKAETSGTDRVELQLVKTSGTARAWCVAVAGTANGHGAPDQSFYIGDVTAGQNRFAIRSDGNVCVGTNQSFTKLTVNGAVATMNNGVDGTYAACLYSVYNVNNTELNAIYSAVSTTASGSGWSFHVSNGGGSAATTEALRVNRDATRVIGNLEVGGQFVTFGAAYNAVINTPYSMRINIDSNNDNSGENFTIGNNQTGIDNSNVLFRVTEDGRVGINGVTSPGYNLEVNGNGLVSSNFQVNGNLVMSGQVFASNSSGNPLRLGINEAEKIRIDTDGHVKPIVDNTTNLGSGSNRWGTVYAGTGTINTSDAREKTVVSAMSSDELNAAKQLAKEIGSYKFLSAVAAKGDEARKHIGMTVQRAIEIMQANNLNPFAYGFICYDQWIERVEEGEVIIAAGDRYSFRPDELLMFIARGQEERLAILEALAAQHL